MDGDAARLRVSDADRDRAAAELSEHFQAGRLTQDEFGERVGKAISARTRGDLDELLDDLPADRPAGSLPSTAAVGQPPPRRQSWTALWAGPAVMVPVVLIAVAITALPGRPAHWVFPWWLIPLAFLALRRRQRACRGRPPRRLP